MHLLEEGGNAAEKGHPPPSRSGVLGRMCALAWPISGALLGTALALLVTSTASAVTSQVKYFSISGSESHNLSFGSVGTAGDSGSYIAKDPSDPKAAANHLGVRARVYFDGGALCQRTSTLYNDERTSNFEVRFHDNCGGYVYSQGFTRVWNGTAYTDRVTYKTANWNG